jgi:hypothetical protein
MRIKQAEYVKDYKIKLLFSDGITKIVDFKPFLTPTRKLCIPLFDLEYFKSFYLDEITICWPNELDFSPDVLYDAGQEVKSPASKQKPARKPRKTKSTVI